MPCIPPCVPLAAVLAPARGDRRRGGRSKCPARVMVVPPESESPLPSLLASEQASWYHTTSEARIPTPPVAARLCAEAAQAPSPTASPKSWCDQGAKSPGASSDHILQLQQLQIDRLNEICGLTSQMRQMRRVASCDKMGHVLSSNQMGHVLSNNQMGHVLSSNQMGHVMSNASFMQASLPPALMDRAEAQQLLRASGVDTGRLEELAYDEQLRAACLTMLEPLEVVWLDGVFDLMHYGHMYTFLQARKLGHKLIVGVNDDHSVSEAKGTLPAQSAAERAEMVRSCKFVDEVVEGVPYVMDSRYLNEQARKHKVKVICHGNDPCLDKNGNDVYAEAKARGMYRTIHRVTGISTTELIGRMLTHIEPSSELEPAFRALASESSRWRFTATGDVYHDFLDACHVPNEEGKPVVYVDGTWDMLHVGHVQTLNLVREMARSELGSEPYLIVGVHDYKHGIRGLSSPIMNLQERVLAVMAIKPVDDVVVDAPLKVTEEHCCNLGVDLVFFATYEGADDNTAERFEYPMAAGILRTIVRPRKGLTIETMLDTVKREKKKLHEQYRVKSTKENNFYQQTLRSQTKAKSCPTRMSSFPSVAN